MAIGDFAGGDSGPGGSVAANFLFDNGNTVWGESVYVVGSVARLGAWEPAKGVKLDPTAYPSWTGTVDNLPANAQIEWKCVKRPENATQPVVQPGPNNLLVTGASGTASSAGNLQP